MFSQTLLTKSFLIIGYKSCSLEEVRPKLFRVASTIKSLINFVRISLLVTLQGIGHYKEIYSFEYSILLVPADISFETKALIFEVTFYRRTLFPSLIHNTIIVC